MVQSIGQVNREYNFKVRLTKDGEGRSSDGSRILPRIWEVGPVVVIGFYHEWTKGDSDGSKIFTKGERRGWELPQQQSSSISRPKYGLVLCDWYCYSSLSHPTFQNIIDFFLFWF